MTYKGQSTKTWSRARIVASVKPYQAKQSATSLVDPQLGIACPAAPLGPPFST